MGKGGPQNPQTLAPMNNDDPTVSCAIFECSKKVINKFIKMKLPK
jgi:hypothetical protein